MAVDRSANCLRRHVVVGVQARIVACMHPSECNIAPTDQKPALHRFRPTKPPIQRLGPSSPTCQGQKSLDLASAASAARVVGDTRPPDGGLWTIPNLLSVSRIAATPLLCHLMLNGEWKVAGLTFVAIALTDAVIHGFLK